MENQKEEEAPELARPHHTHRAVLGILVLVLVVAIFGIAYWFFGDRLQQTCADGACEPEEEVLPEATDQAGSPLTVPPPSALPSVPQGFPIDAMDAQNEVVEPITESL